MISNSQLNSIEEFKTNEKWLIFGLLGIYLALSVIWYFLTDAPWDDDCVGRYYNAKAALDDPKHFISLWNRPLFILLFFIPFQISKHAILLMAVISASGAYALYQVAKELKISNAYLVIPFLLFQAFFFTISRNSLAEPLAATIISFGYLFYLKKKFLPFAIIGSLLPLARLELSPLLILWAYILLKNRRWKYIALLAVPTIIWNFAGTYLEGDVLWLYRKTIGADNTANRYGHTTFGHYFQRYIYVIGPIIFYFFLIGFIERLRKRKIDTFLIVQFAFGFFIYVIFSWKLNMGQAAGFLRHLITLSPLASLIGLYGYNYWIDSLYVPGKISTNYTEEVNVSNKKLLEERIKEIRESEENQDLKPKQIRYLINAEKRKLEQEKSKIIEERKTQEKFYQKAKYLKYRMILYSCVIIVLAFLFFSKKLVFHHTFSDVNDYTNVLITSALLLVFITLAIIFHKKSMAKGVKLGIALLIAGGIIGYTLITEPPDAHNSPERETMGNVSDLIYNSYLRNYNIYVNHKWFFWVNDLDFDRETYKLVTQENIKAAPDSSIIIWENHYSQRLSGDVQLNFFQNKPEFVELFRMYSSDKKFIVLILQKIQKPTPQGLIKVYDRLITLYPDLSSAYLNRGNVRFNFLKDFNEAINDYNKAIQLDTGYVDAYFNKGLAYFNMQKFAEAESSFMKAGELKPDYYQAYYNAAIAMSNLGKFPDAITRYSKVIKLKADYYQAYFYRGIAYTETKEFNKAVEDYTKVVQLKPDDPNAYYNRGLVWLQLGQAEKGCSDFQKANELGYSSARTLLQQYCN